MINHLSHRERLVAQFDAARLGDAQLVLWEHRRPGALDALRQWAAERHISIRERDLRPDAECIAYYVELYPDQDTITVYRQERAA